MVSVEGTAHVVGQGDVARLCWTLATVPVAVALAVSIIRDLARAGSVSRLNEVQLWSSWSLFHSACWLAGCSASWNRSARRSISRRNASFRAAPGMISPSLFTDGAPRRRSGRQPAPTRKWRRTLCFPGLPADVGVEGEWARTYGLCSLSVASYH